MRVVAVAQRGVCQRWVPWLMVIYIDWPDQVIAFALRTEMGADPGRQAESPTRYILAATRLGTI